MAITNAPLGRREFAFFFVVYNYLLHRTAGFVNNQILPIVLGSIRNKHEKFVGRNIFGRTFGVTQNLFFIFIFYCILRPFSDRSNLTVFNKKKYFFSFWKIDFTIFWTKLEHFALAKNVYKNEPYYMVYISPYHII